jgi:hypothetical protein
MRRPNVRRSSVDAAAAHGTYRGSRSNGLRVVTGRTVRLVFLGRVVGIGVYRGEGDLAGPEPSVGRNAARTSSRDGRGRERLAVLRIGV